jgi:hypothetical protein
MSEFEKLVLEVVIRESFLAGYIAGTRDIYPGDNFELQGSLINDMIMYYQKKLEKGGCK